MTNQGFGSQLLYRNATGLEKALADVDADRITKTDAELIIKIWSPEDCPLTLLPYLAWAYGVEYWNDDWSETTKRTWVASQLEFKSMRGTEAALKMAVDYAGRDVSRWGYKVQKVYTQPMKVFSGPSLTRAEREAWLKNLPQVRTWRIQEQGTASEYKAFYNSSSSMRMHSRRFCMGGAALIPSDAITRLKRRCRWIENGVETDITVEDFGSYFRLHKSGTEDGKVFCSRPFGLSRHFIPSDAHDRLITIAPYSPMSWRLAMTPTLQAVTSEPERVAVSGTRKHNVFCDVPAGGFFVPTTAPLRIYWRYAVLDSRMRELRRSPVQFMGVGRYNFPPFTAWAEVTVGNVMSKWAAGFGFYTPKLKFYVPHNGKPLEQVRLAAQASKSLRDKILLRFIPQPQTKFRAGGHPVLADIDTMIAS